MRGDHGPDSDLDIALVGGPWRDVSLADLRRQLGGARTGWIPLVRKQFDPPPRAMCIPLVLVRVGVRLWGRPLPEAPLGCAEGSLMNVEHAYVNLRRSIEFLGYTARNLATADRWARDPSRFFSSLEEVHENAASNSARASGRQRVLDRLHGGLEAPQRLRDSEDRPLVTPAGGHAAVVADELRAPGACGSVGTSGPSDAHVAIALAHPPEHPLTNASIVRRLLQLDQVQAVGQQDSEQERDRERDPVVPVELDLGQQVAERDAN